MTENRSLDILKNAILLEKQGKAFYRTAASQSTHADVKAFFENMAAEEVEHVKILSDQFKTFKETGKFKASDTSKMGTISRNVLTPGTGLRDLHVVPERQTALSTDPSLRQPCMTAWVTGVSVRDANSGR